MTTISLRFPEELDQRLRPIAAQRGMSKSAFLREVPEYYIEQAPERRNSRLATASDLVDCVDGPSDLSHNKCHLQGFGE
ncbi:MAG: ribbon-helix-helix protein, CopG family [Lentisphaerae bacterium]|jgi:hypothetical protein|nr:ribbon-helix-helix protein, CopG family [Lentisphaerota bacterium]MBT6148649.1 ribbon-helix-helix protein, CopG family [Gemmatimonadota bacterium]MBT4820541.1 ribbon-helix-helix protein, CopG family [Lentisphaerota bacterium]MBT5612361.1 ribbon-helix-helix protein, CopG family [Lentisphaerota bacterium]MBT7056665.1 ribbon-helix-helix protein, CopG family [Lentisphaerota bacterium]